MAKYAQLMAKMCLQYIESKFKLQLKYAQSNSRDTTEMRLN